MPPPKHAVKNLKNETDEPEKEGFYSDGYEQRIEQWDVLCKFWLAILFIWAFCTGSKNLDFMWSYIGVL